jgi:hypothetical protein
MDLQAYLKIKKKVENYQRELDQAKGILKQLTADLQQNYGCQTLKQAKKLLRKLKRRECDAEKEFETQLKEFEAKWGERLH